MSPKTMNHSTLDYQLSGLLHRAVINQNLTDNPSNPISKSNGAAVDRVDGTVAIGSMIVTHPFHMGWPVSGQRRCRKTSLKVILNASFDAP